ncbi:MAG: NAD(P)H-binding protein [Bacteroidota bacterium]
MPTVAIAGASGFVGTALRASLSADHNVVGLTRSPARAARNDPEDPTEWRHCDLFSLLEIERALDGVDLAVYLVHSMLPSSRLTQGTFADLDLILADNFARGAATAGVRQIVYLSGLLPDDTDDLSHHLRSRYEVEKTLAAHGVPVTTLRTGLVVGPGGSSLRILVNLVRRLPAMVLPKWTESDTQPIALRDVIRTIRLVLGHPEAYDGTFDVAGPDVMNYREMMERTADVMNLERPMYGVPFITPRLSTLWVSLVSGSSQALAGPLVASLRHDMVATSNPLQKAIEPDALGFEAALQASLDDDGALLPDPRQSHRRTDDATIREARLVRSVQRFELPSGRTAEWAGREYMRWLNNFVGPIIRVRVTEADGRFEARFHVRPLPRPVLELAYAPDRSDPDRALFYVTGGLLARTEDGGRGRLEFRSVLNREWLVAAIHDFSPRLPWGLYRLTQAVAHLFVMHRFGRHLARLDGHVEQPLAPRAASEAPGVS